MPNSVKGDGVFLAGPVDADHAVFRLELVADVLEPVLVFTEHFGDAGERADVSDRHHGQAAAAASFGKFQGSSSSMRDCG